MHVKTSFMDKRESRADREKIISGAEEFLQVHAWCLGDVCVCVCVVCFLICLYIDARQDLRKAARSVGTRRQNAKLCPRVTERFQLHRPM
jgi:hypothetical protein